MPELESVDVSKIEREDAKSNSNTSTSCSTKPKKIRIEEVADDSSMESLVKDNTIDTSLVVNKSDDNIIESIEDSSVEKEDIKTEEEQEHADSLSFDSVSFTNLEELD